MDYTNPFLNPTGSVTDYVVGSGGSTRHVGNFTEDNTYYQQLKTIEESGGYGNTNNQDLDALYERAVEEQARLDNLAMTEELNWRKLQEQRAYDSDVQKVARARAAGINLDLAGGSGSSTGGSSASMPATNIEPVQGQTKFNNAYDNTSLVFNGISAAGSLLSTLTGVAGTVMNGISQFRLLGPEVQLKEAQAGLASARANKVNTLLEGNKTAQDLSNSSAYLDQLAQVSQLTKADIDDESLSPFLSAIGLTDEQLPGAISVIRELHKNPEALSKFYDDSNKLRANKLYNELFTESFLREMMRVEQSVANNQIQSDFYLSSITKTMNELLFNDETYASDLASAQSGSAELAVEQVGLSLESIPLQREQLKYDTAALEFAKARLLGDIKSFMSSLVNREKAINALVDKRTAIHKNAEGRLFTYNERSISDAITAEIIALQSLNASQFSEMHHHFIKGAFSYSQRDLLDGDGMLRETDSFRQSLNNFSSATYFSLFPQGMTIEGRSLSDRDYSISEEQLRIQQQQQQLARDKYVQDWVSIATQLLTGGATAYAIGRTKTINRR